MSRLLGMARYVVIVAVAGLAAMMIATFGLAIAKTIKLIGELLDGGWREDLALVDVLSVIDAYLLAIVQLIVALGLYELFIGSLDLPAWLKAKSLDDLKKSIVDVLIVFVGVKGVELLVASKEPIDALTNAGAVAVLVVALSFFRLSRTSKGPTGTSTIAGITDVE